MTTHYYLLSENPVEDMRFIIFLFIIIIQLLELSFVYTTERGKKLRIYEQQMRALRDYLLNLLKIREKDILNIDVAVRIEWASSKLIQLQKKYFFTLIPGMLFQLWLYIVFFNFAEKYAAKNHIKYLLNIPIIDYKLGWLGYFLFLLILSEISFSNIKHRV